MNKTHESRRQRQGSSPTTRCPDPHALLIREGMPSDTEFFLQMEEQTTWESLPADKAGTLRRKQLRETLVETHGLLLKRPGNVFFIAKNALTGERAGLLWLGPRRNSITGEHEAWIYNVAVVPQSRGCGVAKRLIAHAESYACTQGYGVIGLSVAVQNQIARGLYQKLEYLESNVLMRKLLSTGALRI